MRKNKGSYLLLCLTAAFTISACSKQLVEEGNEENTAREASVKLQETLKAEEDAVIEADGENQYIDPRLDYQGAYREVLEELYQVAIGNHEDYFDIGGGMGIFEIIHYGTYYYDNQLEVIGYAYQDISGDEIPELLIVRNGHTGEAGDEYGGNEVIACYTLKEGQNDPILTFEGSNRNLYYYVGDGSFYHWGSDGASNSLEGMYHITEDGTALEAERIYFTTEDGYYTNTSGEMDVACSEKLEVSEEEFDELYDDWLYLYELIPISTFWEMADTKLLVETEGEIPEDILLRWAAEGDEKGDHVVTFTYGEENEYQTAILLMTESVRKDFHFMTLTMTDMDKSYHMIYEANSVFTQDYFVNGFPIVITLTFHGDIPEYGFSYTDAAGSYHTYAINISGESGELYIIPLAES